MNDFWHQLTTLLNNRELAAGCWIIAILVFGLFKTEVRKSLGSLIGALLQPRLLVFFGIIAATVAGLCLVYSKIGLWETDQVTATILWFLMSGCVMAGRALSAKEDEGHFKGLFRDNFKLTGLFEFVVVAQSFSLVAEIMMLPVFLLLGGIIVIADRDPEHAKVKVLAEWIVVILVSVLLWNSVSHVWSNPSEYFTTKTGRNFILPVILTIGCIPVFYVLFCYSHIQGARIQIDLKTFQSAELKRYAKKWFIITFMACPWLLRRATRQFHTLPAKTNEDIHQIIFNILQFERDRDVPPEVDADEGWSPHLARDFLKDHYLRTNDYHKGYDQYWAESGYIDLDDHLLPNTAIFYLEGVDGVVKNLKLTGKFRDEFDSTKGMVELRTIAETLCLSALNRPDIDIDFGELLPSKDVFENVQIIDNTELKAWSERYPNDKGHEVFLTLSR